MPIRAAIMIEGLHRYGELRLVLLDRGPGLPIGREGEVFETFRRLEGFDRAPGAPASALPSSRRLPRLWA
ncbi:hypothetical protein [Sphingomonas sp. CROZ-RG-20F-R02-07]|uniref:hypothetical protein n=1 Tax=Sphingomonas sp. CROZ-RG-20F-R02-07 TaxID=2914832 RepID=UPI001F56053B|nr:hypothetical protein [Sphingomonas sp. CROZ-RG-20F-R02-07]